MSINRLVIVATIEGVKNVVTQIGSIGNAAASTQQQTSLLGKSLGALFGAIAIDGIRRYSDEYINLQNKLKIVTEGTSQLGVVTDKLYGIAMQTRSAFSDTAKLYQRVALSGVQLGNSQETNLRLTELLNKAIIISGSSSIEASNAMIQLSQGLAKGTLNGDELRSVLEQLPNVADLIARHMGVTRGELRDLGALGKITAQIVQESILAAGDSIDKTFSTLTPTISQAFVNLESSIVNFLGKLNETTGLATGVAKAVLLLADNLDAVAGAAVLVGAAFAALKASQLAAWLMQVQGVVFSLGQIRGIAMQVVQPMTKLQLGVTILSTAFRQGAAAMMAWVALNPFTAVIAGLVILLPLMYQYGDQVTLTTDQTFTLRDLFNQLGSAISAGVTPVLGVLSDILTALGTQFTLMVQTLGTILSAFTGYADILQFAGGSQMSFGTLLYALIEGFAYMTRVLAAGPIFLLRAFAEILYGLGAVSETAMTGIRLATDKVLNLGEAALAAQGRILSFAQGTTQAGAAAAGATGGLNNYAAGSNAAAAASGKAAAAIKEKQSWLLAEDILYTKIAGGQVQQVTIWNSMTGAINAQKMSLSGHVSATKMSSDGVNAITASEAYYAEQAKKSKERTDNLTDSTSKLNTQAVKPAADGLTALGTASATSATGLQKAAAEAGLLKDKVASSTEAFQSQVTAMNNAATAAYKLADAYRALAAAAAAAAAAKSAAGSSSSSGGSSVLHSGGIAGGNTPMRYHTGGMVPMGPDEISAILQRGEEVLTANDPRHRDNIGSLGAPGPSGSGLGLPATKFVLNPNDFYQSDRSNDATILRNGGLNSTDDVEFGLGNSLYDITKRLQTLAQTTGQDQVLPEMFANIARSDFDGRQAATMFGNFNIFDPFAKAIKEFETEQALNKVMGRMTDFKGNADDPYSYNGMKRLQGIFYDSLKSDWVTESEVKQLHRAQGRTPDSVHDMQTFSPGQPGYQGPSVTGWSPDLIATKGGGGKEGDINIKVELKANDEKSFRQNAATVDAMMYAAVERAKRRVNR